MPYKDPEKQREAVRKASKRYYKRKRRGLLNVGYAFVVGDLIHFGHLHFLRECKKHCDFLIVGVYTDKLTQSYKRRPIIPFVERIQLVQSLKPVDMTVTVENRSCIPMLKQLINDGWNIKYLFHGTDWNPDTDDDLRESKKYIESVGGKLVQPEYFEGRTTTSIIKEILRRYVNGENIVGKQKNVES